MRGTDRLQKILYVIMILLGIYIVYKAGSIVLGSPAVRSLFDSGSMQRNLEDAAVRTWAPGYAAAIESSDQDGEKWAGAWMNQLVPAYSFLADGQASAPEETESGTEQTKSGLEETESGTEQTADRPESEPGQTETDGAQAESEADEGRPAQHCGGDQPVFTPSPHCAASCTAAERRGRSRPPPGW